MLIFSIIFPMYCTATPPPHCVAADKVCQAQVDTTADKKEKAEPTLQSERSNRLACSE